MSTKVFVEIRIKKEKLEEVRPLFSTLLHETRSRDGNEGVTVYSDQAEPTTIVLTEQCASRRQYEEYNQWRAEHGDLAKLAELIQEPPQRPFFDFVGVWAPLEQNRGKLGTSPTCYVQSPVFRQSHRWREVKWLCAAKLNY